MATVSATSGGVVGNAYVQFGDSTDPTVFVGSLDGQNVSGFLHLSVTISTNSEVTSQVLLVDGSPFCGLYGDTDLEQETINTQELTNGAHALQGAVTDAFGYVTYSNLINVTVSNDLSGLALSNALVDPTDSAATITLSCQADQPWVMQMADPSGQTVAAAQGDAGAASCSWTAPGNAAPGVYTATAYLQAEGYTPDDTATVPGQLFFSVSPRSRWPGMLAMGYLEGEDPQSRANIIAEVNAVAAACASRYVRLHRYRSIPHGFRTRLLQARSPPITAWAWPTGWELTRRICFCLLMEGSTPSVVRSIFSSRMCSFTLPTTGYRTLFVAP